MASSTEISEGMIGRHIEVRSFRDWLKSRKKESYFILRPPNFTETLNIQRRIAFYLNEPYRLGAVIDWMKPGGSVCTSYVAKILVTANVAPQLKGRSLIFPGALYRRLKELGFKEIPSGAFFVGSRAIPNQRSFDTKLRLFQLLNKIQPVLEDACHKMTGWTTIIEANIRNNPTTQLALWSEIAGNNFDAFYLELAETCSLLLQCVKLLKDRGPTNWKDGFADHDKLIKLLTQIAAEHYVLMSIFEKFLSMEAPIPSAKPILNASDVAIYKEIITYLQIAILSARNFRAILGVT